jgi:hypothetical protein
MALLVLPLGTTHAQETAEKVLCMVLTQKGGTVSKFALRDAPVITYEAENVIVSCGEQQLTTEMASITAINFEEDEIDGIETVANPEPKANFSFNEASFSGMKAGEAVSVYTIDGKALFSSRANAEGNAHIDLNSLPHGIYILRTPSHTYKIKK